MSKKILAVDDEPDILKVVIFRLKKEGYDIKTAINGQMALDMIAEDRPDLILLDITLPVLNGFEVCRRIKADEHSKDIPVMFLTASTASEGFKERAAEAGAQDYMFKPFDYDELLAKIKKMLS
ncbi:MAG: response regulator [Candidatus Omnitrophica bacterium]|nr:response regulator [Candidatus Omnitrophota bacterium]